MAGISKSQVARDRNTQALRRTVTTVLIVGSLLLGYGWLAKLETAFLPPVLFGAIAIPITVEIGVLYMSTAGIIGIWLQTRTPAKPLTGGQLAVLAVVGTLIAFAVTIVALGLRGPAVLWTLLGLGVLSSQLVAGHAAPTRRRLSSFLAETGAVFGISAAVLLATSSRVNLDSLIAVSSGAAVLFVLFGSLLYLLGNCVRDTTN